MLFSGKNKMNADALVSCDEDETHLYVHVKLDSVYKEFRIATIDLKTVYKENIDEAIANIGKVLHGKSYNEWEKVLTDIKNHKSIIEDASS